MVGIFFAGRNLSGRQATQAVKLDWVRTRLSAREQCLLEDVPGVRERDRGEEIHISHYPLIARDLPTSTTPESEELRPYQAEGVAFLRSREGALLADSCGLGKTRQVIAACEDFPVVVVGPRIAVREKGVWLAEARRFFPEAEFAIITGRKQEPLPEADFYFINYDILYHRWGQFFDKKLGVLVLDEAHKLTNRKAQRTQAVLALSAQADRVYAVTATPMPNRPANLWSLLHCINSGAWGAYWEFTHRYAAARPNDYGWEAKGLSNKDELRSRLGAVMLQRFWFEVSDQVPDVTRERLGIELEGKDKRRYLQIDADLRLAIQQRARAAKLQQITALRKLCGLIKVKSVVDFLMDYLPEESVVIWIWHHEVADALEEAFRKKRIDCVQVTGRESGKARDKAIEDFQAKRVPVMLAQYEAAGTSADFTTARLAAFAELSWVPVDLQQAEGRTWRWKQANACMMYYFVVEGTVEEMVLKFLWKKAGFTSDALGDPTQVDLLSQIDEREDVDHKAELLDLVEKWLAVGRTGEWDA